MIERIIITGLVIAIMIAMWLVFRSLHIRKASKAMAMIRVTSSRPSLLYFSSDHCAPCDTQSRHLSQLKEECGRNFSIRHIDTDLDPETADRYGVFTVPTTLIVDQTGNVRYINYGLTASTRLARQLEKVI
jgi:thiol-disulfide isomerase/thioredoxin